ncbi:uncharacterized protein LOC129738363 [Uranotaenia lowii]|uniref:uncharacterized protein LOC129738363 n=1 Tax=Uranotaenia lowii TaxID=190385 RepID=UPI0024799F72|nr:uncharacterized protein LOC129738363 [Uranotaenia lowii]
MFAPKTVNNHHPPIPITRAHHQLFAMDCRPLLWGELWPTSRGPKPAHSTNPVSVINLSALRVPFGDALASPHEQRDSEKGVSFALTLVMFHRFSSSGLGFDSVSFKSLKPRANAKSRKLGLPQPDGDPALAAMCGLWVDNMRMSGESGETLHLVSLERESAGSYACAASNTEGETRSSSISLKIQYAPRCKPGTEQTSVGSLNMHSLHVKCEVEADPPDGIRFSWTYNNTRNVSPVLNSRINSQGLVSTMTYMPQSDAELVTLACWAMNSVGRQNVPCLIHILPAKIPETPRNCELHNDSVLEVVCQPGNDGGLMQSFLLEVVGGIPPPPSMFSLDYTRSPPTEIDNEISTMNDQATLAPLFRIQEQMPQFKLHSLEPGRDYQLMVYAVNAKGKSDPPFVIEKVRVGSALIPPYVDETIISEDPTPAETSNADKQKQHSQMVVFAAVVAAAGVVLTSIVVAGFVAICRLKRPKPPEPQEVRKRMRPARTDVPSMYAEDDVFDDEYQRHPGGPGGGPGGANSNDPRCSRASSTLRSSRYISEGFVQYSQPSLNDPDLILPRGTEMEFTTLSGA